MNKKIQFISGGKEPEKPHSWSELPEEFRKACIQCFWFHRKTCQLWSKHQIRCELGSMWRKRTCGQCVATKCHKCDNLNMWYPHEFQYDTPPKEMKKEVLEPLDDRIDPFDGLRLARGGVERPSFEGTEIRGRTADVMRRDDEVFDMNSATFHSVTPEEQRRAMAEARRNAINRELELYYLRGEMDSETTNMIEGYGQPYNRHNRVTAEQLLARLVRLREEADRRTDGGR